MRFLEQLFRYLSKVIYEANRCILLQRVVDTENVTLINYYRLVVARDFVGVKLN